VRLRELRQAVCDANRALVTHGLVTLTWGNVSGIDRAAGLVAIKPSGVAYDRLRAADIVLVDLAGTVAEGTLRPSSDTPTHLALRSPRSAGSRTRTVLTPRCCASAAARCPASARRTRIISWAPCP